MVFEMAICWPFVSTGLMADRASSEYNSFTEKMVLKDHSSLPLEKTLLDIFIAQISCETELRVNIIVLLGRWS